MFVRVWSVYRSAFSGLPRQVWILAGIALVNRAGTMVFPFLSLYFTQSRGLSISVAGRIISFYGLGAIVGAWSGGYLSDRIGPVRTQQWSLLLSGFGFLAFLRVDSILGMSVGGFLLGAIVESFRPANMAALSHAAPRGAQARSFGLLRLCVNLGMGIGPAVGGLLAVLGYHWLFIVDASTCWIAAVLLGFAIGNERVERNKKSEPSEGRVALSPLQDRPFLLLLALVFLVALLFFQVFTVLPLFLKQDLGFREDHVGAVLAFNALLIVLFEMPLTSWSERRDRMLIVAWGALLVGAGLALTPWGVAVPWLLFSVSVWTFGEMLVLPMFNAVIAGRADPKMMGRYMGFYTMAFSLAFVVAPSLGAWTYATYGGKTLWTACGILGLVAASGCYLLRNAIQSPQVPALLE